MKTMAVACAMAVAGATMITAEPATTSAPDLMKAWRTDKESVIEEYGGERLIVFGYVEKLSDGGFGFTSDVKSFGVVPSRDADRIVVNCELWGLQFISPHLVGCRESDYVPDEWPTLEEAIAARTFEHQYEVETEGPHAGKVTRDSDAIANFDPTGAWAIQALSASGVPTTGAYIRLYDDGSVVLLSVTCGTIATGAWVYEDRQLVLIDTDGTTTPSAVLGVPPRKRLGERFLFDTGFWNLISVDPDMDC